MHTPTYRTLRGEQLSVVPWKNGAGLTTEIARGQVRSKGEDWAWRVSVADVGASGPFSTFPGIDRTSCVIEGDGMDLRFDDGSTLALDPGQPADYDGGANVTGTLRTGSVRNFNVMVVRNIFRATLDLVHGPNECRLQTHSGAVLLVHMLEGQCCVINNQQTPETIRGGGSVLVEGENAISLKFATASRAVIVHLQEPSRIATDS